MTLTSFPQVRCMALTPTPEWMVESLPVMATGHEDGTVRWWVVREPTSLTPRPGLWLPHATTAVPVDGGTQPAWELVEVPKLRLRASERAPVTSIYVSDSGGPKLLWAGDAAGEVRSFSVSVPDTDEIFHPMAGARF